MAALVPEPPWSAKKVPATTPEPMGFRVFGPSLATIARAWSATIAPLASKRGTTTRHTFDQLEGHHAGHE